MTQEESKESFRMNLDSLLSQKLTEHTSFGITLESISGFCEQSLKDQSKKYSSAPLNKSIPIKLVQTLETLVPSSDLSLFKPILTYFSQTLSTSIYSLSGNLINSLCVFLISHHSKPYSSDLVFCIARIIDVLYCIGLQKKKKSENFDPAWKSKIFIVFCDLFEEIVKEDLQDLARLTVDLNLSLLVNEESKVRKVLNAVDLELYLALAVTHLGKHVNVSSCDGLISTINGYLTAVAFALSGKMSSSALMQEKSVICFAILSTISILLNKVEIFRTVLKLNWESIINLYTFTIISVKDTEKSNNFTEDPSIIGQLYTEILDLSVCCISSELENFPISLFIQLNKFVKSK